MDLLYFNVNDGYLEGIVRGYKAGVLTQMQYNNLTQCETIEGASSAECDLALVTNQLPIAKN